MKARTPQEQAANKLVQVLESPLLQALLEPARLEILRLLLVSGASDVGAIAAHLPQHRSVISRHLGVLREAGIVREARSSEDARLRIFQLDGVRFVQEFEEIVAQVRTLTVLCCSPITTGQSEKRRR